MASAQCCFTNKLGARSVAEDKVLVSQEIAKEMEMNDYTKKPVAESLAYITEEMPKHQQRKPRTSWGNLRDTVLV